MIFLGQLAEDKAQISLEGPFLHPGNTSQINPTEDDSQYKITKHTCEIKKQNKGWIRHLSSDNNKKMIKTINKFVLK